MKLWLKICYFLASLGSLWPIFSGYIFYYILRSGNSPDSFIGVNSLFQILIFIAYLLFGLSVLTINKFTNIALFIQLGIAIISVLLISVSLISSGAAMAIFFLLPLSFISKILLFIGSMIAIKKKFSKEQIQNNS